MKKILFVPLVVVFLAAGCSSNSVSQNTTSSAPEAEAMGTPTPSQAQPQQTPTPSATAATPKPTSSGVKTFTMADVSSANSASYCLTVINNKVYNLTSWINSHPGGREAILSLCGKDGTRAFESQHGGDKRPENTLAGFYAGDLTK